MQLTLAYRGRSGLRKGRQSAIALMPNLARDAVAFDGELREPLRFREAISALHDVVTSDLRFQRRDKSAYLAWKQQDAARVANVRRTEHQRAKQEILSRRGDVPADLESDYRRHLRSYWDARQKYANFLARHDPGLWRKLMPCDPVITVAPDVLFFECFSADESSYGCLTAERDDCFAAGISDVQFGTTNVDYSWELFRHFQSLRTYRQTRLHVDPAGFSLQSGEEAEYREEKIDLPPSWLRGFLQVQAAMSLPLRRVPLSREAVYSLLAWLRRHKARTGPRAIRFELLDGRPPAMLLEPWEQRIESRSTRYAGPACEAIRVWGRQRLLTLSRVLPLAERFDVYLLGNGLPSFWVARLGAMRLTLGLSGWTTNDWTRGSALDGLLPPHDPAESLVSGAAEFVRSRQSAKLSDVAAKFLVSPGEAAAALNRLARRGQVIFDLAAGTYRWRQVLPRAIGEADVGPENEEVAAARTIDPRRAIKVTARDAGDGNATKYAADVAGHPVELLLDADGNLRRGRCNCSHHFRFGLRQGPCRHLLALRSAAWQPHRTGGDETTAKWYDRLRRMANGP